MHPAVSARNESFLPWGYAGSAPTAVALSLVWSEAVLLPAFHGQRSRGDVGEFHRRLEISDCADRRGGSQCVDETGLGRGGGDLSEHGVLPGGGAQQVDVLRAVPADRDHGGQVHRFGQKAPAREARVGDWHSRVAFGALSTWKVLPCIPDGL